MKCRPPGNRNPKPEEIEACSPFLREQIRSVWPDVMVSLGNFASQWVLKTDKGVIVCAASSTSRDTSWWRPPSTRPHASTTRTGNRCSRRTWRA